MAKAKDRPLLLRKRRDGTLHLMDKWPPRHEFSQDWLLKGTRNGMVQMDENEIHLELENASAVYTITLSPGEEGPNGEKTTGFMARLKEGEVK